MSKSTDASRNGSHVLMRFCESPVAALVNTFSVFGIVDEQMRCSLGRFTGSARPPGGGMLGESLDPVPRRSSG